MWHAKPLAAFTDNYLWLLTADKHNAQAAMVDPGDAAPVVAALDAANLELAAILITHHHADHIGGVSELMGRYPNARVYGPEDQRIPMVQRIVRDQDSFELDFLAAEFEVIEVPGHTKTHIAYYAASNNGVPARLFCGDTIFACGCGRLFEGTPVQMHRSLTRLRALDKQTEIYCAHEYTLDNIAFAKWVEPDSPALLTRERTAKSLRAAGQPTVPSQMDEECRTNPFLRFDQPTVVAAAEHYAGRALTSEAEVFGAVRHWKDTEFD